MNSNDPLAGVTIEQRKWVLARLTTKSDADAARAIGLHPATVCRWANKAVLDEAIVELLADPTAQALSVILEAVPDAAQVKVAGLRSRNENIKQASASEILDRALGKAKQSMDTNARVSVDMRVTPDLGQLNDDELTALASLARRIAGD